MKVLALAGAVLLGAVPAAPLPSPAPYPPIAVGTVTLLCLAYVYGRDRMVLTALLSVLAIVVWRLAEGPEELLADVHAGVASLLTIAQTVIPGMTAAGGGTIVATGSAAADSPSPGAPTLGVQKAALRSLVQAMALDLAAHGVHCATVTINGLLGAGPAFAPDRIAEIYAELVAETAGPAEAWRTVVDYSG